MSLLNLNIGECVHYGTHGVCRVCGKESKSFGGGERMYFTLRPTSNTSILLYLPEDAEPDKVKLRKLLSRQEILELVENARKQPAGWIADSKLRREAFAKVIRGGDAAELIGMLRDLYLHQQDLPHGKQLPMSDQEMMQNARRQLYSEMAYVLDIDEKAVQAYILDLVEQSNGNA